MRVRDIAIDSAPLARRTRLGATVEFATAGLPEERLWFEVESEHAPALSTSGNPWLAALAPLAVTLGEPLELPTPVDPLLLEGTLALMLVWHGWYPDRCAPVPIHCDVAPTRMDQAPGRTGALFSGGVDSFHTLLRHQPGGSAIVRRPIDDLITIRGFDVPLAAEDAFARLASRHAGVASAVHAQLVTIGSNLRESAWQRTNWGLLGQAPALAASVHALEGRYSRVLLPSSHSYGTSRAWGTHPLADRLLSSSRLEIHNDGAHANRKMKIAAVAQSDLAMAHLRVCWQGQSDRNCGRCEKCLRTLTAFELIGARERCITFPADAWSLDALANLRYRNDLDRRYMGKLAERARTEGRPDIARAIARAMRRHDLRMTALRMARRLGLRGQQAAG